MKFVSTLSVCCRCTFVILKRSNLFLLSLHSLRVWDYWRVEYTPFGIAVDGFFEKVLHFHKHHHFIGHVFCVPIFISRYFFLFFLPLFRDFFCAFAFASSYSVWLAHLSGEKCVFSLKLPSHKSKCKNIFVENHAWIYTSVLQMASLWPYLVHKKKKIQNELWTRQRRRQRQQDWMQEWNVASNWLTLSISQRNSIKHKQIYILISLG